MKKSIAFLALLLTVALATAAQSNPKHKPSAAVHKAARSKASTNSSATAKPNAPTTPGAAATDSGTTVGAPEESLPSSGPLYPDEKGPLPAPSPKLSAKTVRFTPSDLPAGTAIRMRLDTPLSSRTNYEGDSFHGPVTEAVTLQGKTIIPAGASIRGHIVRIGDPRRIAGTGSLRLRPECVTLPNGQSYSISASMVDTSIPKKLTVDEEGRIKARGFNGGDRTEIIAGTGAGAIAGTIIAGGKGTLFGSMIVGGATVVHWLTRRHPVDVPAGTELIMEISHPMTVSRSSLQAGE